MENNAYESRTRAGKRRCLTKRLEELQAQKQWQLLPGIPNEITLALITPKLHWTAVISLPSISRAWQRAIQTREVYAARVQAKAIETLYVSTFFRPDKKTKTTGLPIYSHKEDTWRVRVLPGRLRGYTYEWRFVQYSGWANYLAAHDGKVYLLVEGSRVFVLDVAAGQSEWTECAKMCEPNISCTFAVEGRYVKDGKIHVKGKNPKEDKVYDPKLNIWSSTTPVPPSEMTSSVLAI